MLTYIVKIGYEQFIFDTGKAALAFAQDAKDSITDKDVTVKIVIEYEDPERIEDTEDEEDPEDEG